MRADFRLAARLFRGAGRREVVRIVAMALGVGLATLSIMIGLATPRVASSAHAVQVARSPFFDTGAPGSGLSMAVSTATLDKGPWTRVTVSGQVKGAPLPPGLSVWPAPGHTVVSPALAALARTEPPVARALAVIDPVEIGRAGLTGPGELLSYSRTAVPALGSASPGSSAEASLVSGFGNAATVMRSGSGLAGTLEIALLVLMPALVFLVTALRLSAVARSRRSFILGLAGMSPSRGARLYAVEMALVATAGYVTGALVYVGVEGALGASGLAGIRWWASQARIGWSSLLVVGLVMVGAVYLLARWTMRHAAARSRSERTRPPGRLAAWLALVLGVPALGFLIVVDLHGLTHPTSAWMNDTKAAYVAAAVIAGIAAVILGTPKIVAAWGTVNESRLPVAVVLGLRGAAARVMSSRRLIAFVASAVILASLSAAFVTSLQRSAVGDPAEATISMDVGELTATQDWPASLPRGSYTLDAPVRGTKGNYDVVIGDCVGVRRQAAAVFRDPGQCTDSVQRGTGGIGGETATWLDVAGVRRALPPRHGPLARHVTWDIKLPLADAPWIGKLTTGTITYWVSRTDGSYQRVLGDLTRAFPGVHLDAGVKNLDALSSYHQQIATIRAGSSLGLLLSCFALILAAMESRWERTRSLCTLAAIGVRSRRLRTASAVEFGYAVLVGSLPAAVVGLLGGWAVASFRGTDGMLAGGLWAWALVAAASSVVIAATAGWLVGGAHFSREHLADT